MFARKLKLTLGDGNTATPVPVAWLEQFFLRDFTGHSAFDETLPAADGILEAGYRVPAEEVRTRLEQWLRGRKMIPAETQVRVE